VSVRRIQWRPGAPRRARARCRAGLDAKGKALRRWKLGAITREGGIARRRASPPRSRGS
jgi:hypothetical protein